MKTLSIDPNQTLIVITGASGALGKALKSIYTENGFSKFICVDLHKPESHPQSEKWLTLDLSQLDAWKKVGESINQIEHSKLIWIHTIAIAPKEYFYHSSIETIINANAVNVNAVLIGTKIILNAVLSHKRSANFIILSSIADCVHPPGISLYGASKAYISNFCRSLQTEIEILKLPVHCLLVRPGAFSSSLIELDSGQSAYPNWMKKLIPDPDQVALQIYKAFLRNKKECRPAGGVALSMIHHLLPRFMQIKVYARQLNTWTRFKK